MSTEKKNTEEEVDLGSLFIIIGKGFAKFFNFIGSIFKELFHVFVSLLLFIRKHFIKFVIATILGAGIGFALNFTKIGKDIYEAQMLIQPNFGITKQLYNDIRYYNSLISQKDTLRIMEALNLDLKEASNLKKVEIKPVKNEYDIVHGYNSLALSLDTIASKKYSLKEYKNVFTHYDYRVHTIHAESVDKDVFPKIQKAIINSISKNEYFQRVKNISVKDLYRSDSLFRRNLTQLDSLAKVYMQVLLKESEKTTAGTSIDLGGQNNSVKELDLFQTKIAINNDLNELTQEIILKEELVNVISGFPSVGYKVAHLSRNKIFIGGLSGFVIMFILLTMKSLDAFLASYKKN